MQFRLATWAAAMLLLACGSHLLSIREGSRVDPREASGFWCATSTRQCFTDEQECIGGDCRHGELAWCAVYGHGQEQRYMCAIDEPACGRLREQIAAHDVGECISRTAGRAGAASDLSGILDPPNEDGIAPMPPLHREHRIADGEAAPGIRLAAVPAGAAGWEILASNDTDTVVLIVWDESTFVTLVGETAGRLIRGTTRKIDAANAQPASPIAPHSKIDETVFVEKLLAAEEAEETLAKIATQHVMSDEARAKGLEIRRSTQALIANGHLVVTVQLPTGKQTWAGKVEKAGDHGPGSDSDAPK
jgi:hypothetical protein